MKVRLLVRSYIDRGSWDDATFFACTRKLHHLPRKGERVQAPGGGFVVTEVTHPTADEDADGVRLPEVEVSPPVRPPLSDVTTESYQAFMQEQGWYVWKGISELPHSAEH